MQVTSKKNAAAGPMDSEGMIEIVSPYNEDNVVYQTNRTFIYEVDQHQKNRHICFQLELLVIPGAFNWEESKIKYKYHYNPSDLTQQELKDWGFENGCFRPEFTSLTEKKNDLRLHPPRTKTLACLQKAPFPEIPRRLAVGATREAVLFIPRGNWAELGGSKIKWKFRIDSVAYKNDTLPYFCRVQAEANSKKGGHNTLEIHFQVDSGFTKLAYRFQDLSTVDFILKEIK